jgi:hypothetical protein
VRGLLHICRCLKRERPRLISALVYSSVRSIIEFLFLTRNDFGNLVRPKILHQKSQPFQLQPRLATMLSLFGTPIAFPIGFVCTKTIDPRSWDYKHQLPSYSANALKRGFGVSMSPPYKCEICGKANGPADIIGYAFALCGVECIKLSARRVKDIKNTYIATAITGSSSMVYSQVYGGISTSKDCVKFLNSPPTFCLPPQVRAQSSC